MSMNAITLAREIEQLEKRRVSIAASAEAAREALESARRNLVSGKGEAAEVTTAQSTASALAATVESITEQLSGLRAKLLATQDIERQQLESARVAELEREQAKLIKEHDLLTAQTDEVVNHTAQRIIELRTRYFAASQERSQLLREDRKFLSNDDFLIPRAVSAPMELAMTILERSRATTPERFGNELPQRN
jgi:predicted RNase H-like nuclease (RuvC/YqgF family)